MVYADVINSASAFVRKHTNCIVLNEAVNKSNFMCINYRLNKIIINAFELQTNAERLAVLQRTANLKEAATSILLLRTFY